MNAVATPDAFLSYTRIDDQFYGGSITSLRKLLELGVRVVTGRASFSIFQDIDGTGLGEQYQKLFDQVIANALVFIPIITPLFFSSEACRGEVQKFLAHEQNLGRDDLILPIYYVTSPVLEKPDLLAKDPLEIHTRQRYDWRTQADLAIDDPHVRPAVRQLAEKIASALARKVAPKSEDPKKRPAKKAKKAKAGPGFSARVAPRDDGTIDLKKASRSAKGRGKDYPLGGRRSGQAPRDGGLQHHVRIGAVDARGLEKAKATRFDAIISDMGRPGDPHAGYTLLKALRHEDRTPYFIFSSEVRREAEGHGAQGSTNISEELISDVLTTLQDPPAR